MIKMVRVKKKARFAGTFSLADRAGKRGNAEKTMESPSRKEKRGTFTP